MPLSRATSRYTLAQSAAASLSHTGNTDETALATVTLPASAMGANGRVFVVTHWTVTNSVNNKTLRVRLGGIGGTAHLAFVATTVASHRDEREICNRGVANSQVGFAATAAGGGWGQTAGAVITGAIDTAAATTIVISGQLASAGETITLEAYRIEVMPG
jgi:hypothetical protein